MATNSPHRHAGRGTALLLASVLAFALSASTARAADPAPPPHPAPASGPHRVDPATGAVEDPVPVATDWDALHERAARDGSVRVVVELDPDARGRTKAEHLANLGHARSRLLGEFGRKPLQSLNAIEGSPIVAFAADSGDLAKLRRSRFVRSVTIDEVHDGTGTVSHGAADGIQLQQWWDYGLIGADWANGNGYTGRGQAVVVIDSGVDRSHPWLAQKVTTEACFATNLDGTGACPNGSYYSYSTAASGITGAAAPCTYHFRACAHGTHVAHTAAGQYGTARGAAVVAIRASHAEWDAKRGGWVPKFSNSDLINALWYVYYKLPFVPAAINLSIGGDGYTSSCDSVVPTFTSYVNAFKASGVATVISSGNDDYLDGVSWPGCIANAITVGNTTLDTGGYDAVLGYTQGGSNSSASVDILAPGTDICSAVPVVGDRFDESQDGVACDWFGTSMAAPHVAGAIAQLRQSRPSATVDQMLSALQRRGVAVLDSRNGIVRTRINVANAIFWF